MNVVVAGAEPMALRIAEALMEGHQVVSLRLPGVADNHFERLDVETVVGGPTSHEALRRARASEADAFVAATDNDEQNLVACLAAKKLGAKRTVCVLSRPGFLSMHDEDEELAESLGIDQIVRPAEQLAEEVVRIVTTPGALDVRTFADGQVALMRYRVEANSGITRGPLRSVKLPKGVVLATVRRGDELIVPRGETRLQASDNVVVMGQRRALLELTPLLRSKSDPESRMAAVVGAGQVGCAIARGLMRADWRVTVIEVDRTRCEAVAAELGIMVLHGDGADLSLLEQERIAEFPVVVCVTNNDEKNLLVSLLAKEIGVPRIITRADRLANERMFEHVGVDVALSATGAAVRSIVQSIDTSHSEIRAELDHGDACVIEVTLPPQFPRSKLKDLRPPEHAVVGSITRNRQLVVPGGDDELCPGDEVLVFCRTVNEEQTRRFFMEADIHQSLPPPSRV
jgi:trk system potassium uptake protein TrkA